MHGQEETEREEQEVAIEVVVQAAQGLLMRRRRSGERTPEVMLGRVVTHSSPAELSDQLAPHPDWAQQIIMQQMNPKREHPKPGAMTAPPTKPTGALAPGAPTQTPAYQQYRAGERERTPYRDPYAYGLYSI